MKITIEGSPQEIKELLQAIASSQEQKIDLFSGLMINGNHL